MLDLDIAFRGTDMLQEEKNEIQIRGLLLSEDNLGFWISRKEKLFLALLPFSTNACTQKLVHSEALNLLQQESDTQLLTQQSGFIL